jgi:hypothetical protein
VLLAARKLCAKLDLQQYNGHLGEVAYIDVLNALVKHNFTSKSVNIDTDTFRARVQNLVPIDPRSPPPEKVHAAFQRQKSQSLELSAPDRLAREYNLSLQQRFAFEAMRDHLLVWIGRSRARAALVQAELAKRKGAGAHKPFGGAKGAARHHPLNGEVGAPVPLIGNRAPWTREPQGQMLVDVMLAQLMMTAVMYWVSKRSHLTESMDLAAIIKSKAAAMAKAGDRTMAFPYRPEGEPYDNFRSIITIYEGEKEWLSLEDEAATVTEENRWLRAIMQPFNRIKTEVPDGSIVWSLALPEVYKEKDVLLNIEWVRLVESCQRTCGSMA